MIPAGGWLPEPLNSGVTQFTLPETFKVIYYLCNPGPYDPEQPYELPVITVLAINQRFSVGAGYKNGVWGWFVEIDWIFAYGDALIETVWPPLEPTVVDETSTLEPVNIETCPPDPILVVDSRKAVTVSTDTKASVVLIKEQDVKIGVTSETSITPTIISDAKGI